MNRFTTKPHSKGGGSECHSPAARSPDSNKWAQNQLKLDDLQRDLATKVGQFEREAKGRKDAELRCRETQNKMDRVYEMLQERTEEMEAERRLREEAEGRCRTLQLTIDKLEEYLRKKSANDYHKVGRQETDGDTINDVIKKEREHEETCRLLHRQQKANHKLRQRCQELEKKLRDNDIQYDNFKDNNDIDDELDF